MVLCDGLGCDGFAWKYLAPELKNRYQVVRWHYRGHGKSPMPVKPEAIGVEQIVDDLERVILAAGASQAVVFGHSMGVQVALEFHRRHPARVLGLVLLCGSYGNPLDTFHDHTLLRSAFPYVREVIERYPGLSKRISTMVMKSELAVSFALRAELNPELMQREDMVPYFDHLAHMHPVAFVRTLDSLKDHSAWDHLAAIDVPTLVVGGERDKFTPVWLSRRMAEAIPTAEFVLVPGGSHTAPLERPELVGRTVRKFLNERISPKA
ncbi:MAG: alpha/beta fold hydrolase [Myxococcaceae bacterium]